jgi:hypothetical protein
MQSDTPQGDPRLQRTNPVPKIATGFVDPCIVYLETTLPGEIPLVAACWAASSHEVREPGKPVRLELENVTVFRCNSYRRINGKSGWLVTTRVEDSLTLKHGTGDRLPGCSYFSALGTNPPPVFQWSIRPLDQETDASLRKDFASISSSKWRQSPVTKRVFELAKLDWPSIDEIIASIEKQEARRPVPRGPSFVSRLLSSVFKKKQKPVTA